MGNRNQIRTINIIAKNPYGETVYAESVCYDPKKYKKFEDISKHVKKKLKWPDCVICEYDKYTQQSMLVCDAVSKNGSINWSLPFWKIDIEDAFKKTSGNMISVIAVCFEKAPGLGAGPDTILTIIEFLKILGYLFFAIYYFFFPYKLLLKEFKVNEIFAKDTIKMRMKWNKGFISIDNFRYKNVIEHSIMKKLGYEVVDKKWVNHMINRCKLPNEIVKGE
jgi:hypothetical protein